MLELTTRFTGISTSPQARSGGLSVSDAATKAKANLAYITRPSALGNEDGKILLRGDFRTPDGERVQTHHEAKAAMRAAIDERAARGGKRGTRVAEKMIFSLPNDFPPDAQHETLKRLMARLGDGSREAKMIGTIHRDKASNLHGHILAVDGAETEERARMRRPDAKRVRRRDVIRLGERGRPKELRGLFAEVINEVADERGLTRVEHRSFKERGLTDPTKHEGPTRRAQRRTGGLPDPVAIQNAARRKKRSQRRRAPERGIGAFPLPKPSDARQRRREGVLDPLPPEQARRRSKKRHRDEDER